MAAGYNQRSFKHFTSFHEEVVRGISAQTKQYTRHNIEKALSTTGHKDLPTTLAWLNKHLTDLTLDDDVIRDYIIFLCPTGALLSEISRFYEHSYNKCGSNSAHNLFPHITLTSFFKVSNHVLPFALDRLNEAVQSIEQNEPEKLKLILQRSEGYIGLFLNDAATNWITELTTAFAKSVNLDFGLQVKPHERKFHLTLAYNFDLSKTDELESLAKKINVDANARWELNIYSRDTRYNGKSVHSITENYEKCGTDEIDLQLNNYVIIDSEQTKRAGWKWGIDFESGAIGYFPDNYTKKTAEWRIWTKNYSLPVFRGQQALKSTADNRSTSTDNSKHRRSQSLNLKKDKRDTMDKRGEIRSSLRTNTRHNEMQQSLPNIQSSEQKNQAAVNGEKQYPMYVADNKSSQNSPATPSKSRSSSKRKDRENTINLLQQHTSNSNVNTQNITKRLFAMRHAERVDLTFGHDWFQVFIDDRGYHRRNLNLPRRIPTRRNGPRDFFMDCPITEVGTFQSRLAGEALRAKGVKFSAVFSSPSLRSVQTAAAVLEGLGESTPPIKIEPALFEWMAWCRNAFPKFMTVEELLEYGIRVDKNYAPFYALNQFNLHEKTDEYYFRSHSFIQFATRKYPGNVLVVGHSATLDVCTRQLTGKPIRKTDDLIRVVQKVPYCGLCVAEENQERWKLVQAPIPSLTHGQNQAFDWRELESQPNAQNGHR